jgi:hypothetical protein
MKIRRRVLPDDDVKEMEVEVNIINKVVNNILALSTVAPSLLTPASPVRNFSAQTFIDAPLSSFGIRPLCWRVLAQVC